MHKNWNGTNEQYPQNGRRSFTVGMNQIFLATVVNANVDSVRTELSSKTWNQKEDI